MLCLVQACGGGPGNDATSPNLSIDPEGDIDLRNVENADGLIRIYGSAGQGTLGVPVAGGGDINGDGNQDFAMASMLASPLGRTLAGQISVVLGNGDINYNLDTAQDSANSITIIGDGRRETAGSEIWLGDVTGDGLADLLIARQNALATSPDRIGAGALSIIAGSPALTTLAANNQSIDLRFPPSEINILTLFGAEELDRLGIWMRVGDITGDGVDDIAVGADQSDVAGTNSGVVYVIRGGEQLNANANIDLANIAGSALAGDIAEVRPPASSSNFHFGGTVNVADLDNNGAAELIAAATINRAGASVVAEDAPNDSAQASGGSPDGRVFILWDDNFSGPWPDAYILVADSSLSGGLTDIQGGATSSFDNSHFGEEILGGLDYNGDDRADLFIGDITGNTFNFSAAGLGFVFFDAAQLKGQAFSTDNLPSGIDVSIIFGPSTGAISSDTALHGDFDNDGIDDLAVASPHAAPLGRESAGALHVLWGNSIWPDTINLAANAQPGDEFPITNIYGANGTVGSDIGDTLAYSAAAADLDNDGLMDLIVNEMVGNGLDPDAEDVGNLIVLSGALVTQKKLR